MRTLLIAATLCAGTAAAHAEWTPLTETSTGAVVSLDFESARRAGAIATIWSRNTSKQARTVEGKPYLSSRTQYEFDCTQDTMRNAYVVYSTGPDGTGETSFSGANPSLEHRLITPNSIAAEIKRSSALPARPTLCR